MRYRDLTEDTTPDSVTLYHGGSPQFKYDYREIVANRKSKWEYGTGVYLTNSYSVAQKYGKGSRTIYSVVVSTDAKKIDDIEISKSEVIEFLEKHISKKRIESEYLPYLERSDMVNLTRLSNLCINNNFPSTKTISLRNFFIQHGVDYAIERAFGAYVVVVINPRIILSVERATTTDVTDVTPLI